MAMASFKRLKPHHEQVKQAFSEEDLHGALVRRRTPEQTPEDSVLFFNANLRGIDLERRDAQAKQIEWHRAAALSPSEHEKARREAAEAAEHEREVDRQIKAEIAEAEAGWKKRLDAAREKAKHKAKILKEADDAKSTLRGLASEHAKEYSQAIKRECHATFGLDLNDATRQIWFIERFLKIEVPAGFDPEGKFQNSTRNDARHPLSDARTDFFFAADRGDVVLEGLGIDRKIGLNDFFSHVPRLQKLLAARLDELKATAEQARIHFAEGLEKADEALDVHLPKDRVAK